VKWVLFIVLALVGLLTSAWRWWDPRASADPRRDPGARRVTSAQRQALAALLASEGAPEQLIEQGMAACEVRGQLWWRGGLRQLQSLLDRLPQDDEGQSLRALVAVRLGELEQAQALLANVRPDHWRGCLARAQLYELAPDVERAESALVAASQLAEPHWRPQILEQLEALRRRTRRTPHPHLRLWERAP
jgi:hypothetical protein